MNKERYRRRPRAVGNDKPCTTAVTVDLTRVMVAGDGYLNLHLVRLLRRVYGLKPREAEQVIADAVQVGRLEKVITEQGITIYKTVKQQR